jgi:hypothetical protein
MRDPFADTPEALSRLASVRSKLCGCCALGWTSYCPPPLTDVHARERAERAEVRATLRRAGLLSDEDRI